MSLTYSEWKNPGIPMSQPLADSQLYFGPLNDLNPGRRAGASAIAPAPDSASSASADMLLT